MSTLNQVPARYWTVEEEMLFHHLYLLSGEIAAEQDTLMSLSPTSETVMKALDVALRAIQTERERVLDIARARAHRGKKHEHIKQGNTGLSHTRRARAIRPVV